MYGAVYFLSTSHHLVQQPIYTNIAIPGTSPILNNTSYKKHINKSKLCDGNINTPENEHLHILKNTA